MFIIYDEHRNLVWMIYSFFQKVQVGGILLYVRKSIVTDLLFDPRCSWLISACEVVLPAVIGWFTLKNLSAVDDEYGG